MKNCRRSSRLVGGAMLPILLSVSLFTGIVCHEPQESVNVGIGFLREPASLENVLKKVEMEISERNYGTGLHISSLFLNVSTSSFYSVLASVCNTTAARNISMVIILDDLEENSWITWWFSYVLRVPVSLAYDSSMFGEGEGHFPAVFSMVPSVSEVSTAVAELTRYFGWRDLAILTGEGREGAKIISALLESMNSSDAMATKVLFHRQFNPRDHKHVHNILQTLSGFDVTAIFLHCDSSEVKSIFSAAKINGLLTTGRVWIVTEAVIEGCSTGASNCPPGLVGLRLRRLLDPGEEEVELLQDLVHDSVMVYADTVRRFLKNEKFPRLPLSSCENQPSNGSDKVFKYMFSTSIQGKTGLIKFDIKGNRVDPDYEIVNLKANKYGTKLWVPVALWKQGILEINENKFAWPGISSLPSIGMARKRVLQVVTVVENPFSFLRNVRVFDRYDVPVCGMGYPCKVYNSTTYRSDMTYTFHCCEGLVIDLLKMLEIDVGFQSELHLVKDGKHGAKDVETGEWNGMVGELLRGEADVAIGDLTITELRSHVVDFSHTFLPTGQVLLVLVKTSRAHNWLLRFLDPYSWDLWVASVITVNIVIILLWIIDRVSPLGYYRRSYTVKEKKKFNVETSLWYTWGTIFNVDAEARPKSYSARVVIVFFAFAMTILTSSYTANLAAVLVSEYEELPVNKNSGIKDPKLQDPPQNFKFGTISGSLVETLFKESSNPAYTSIWKNMRNVDGQKEGAEMVLSGELDAFIYDEPHLLYEASQHQQLRVLGPMVLKSGIAFAFPKNSNWTQKFSNILLAYELLEVLQRLNNRWLSGKCGSEKIVKKSNTAIRMDLKATSGAFCLVVIGTVLALIMLFVEFKVAKYGFPLSRLWTNHPNRNEAFSPTPAAPSHDHLARTLSLPQRLGLTYFRRRASVSASETNL